MFIIIDTSMMRYDMYFKVNIKSNLKVKKMNINVLNTTCIKNMQRPNYRPHVRTATQSAEKATMQLSKILATAESIWYTRHPLPGFI